MYSPTNVPILHKMRKQILKLTWNLKRSWRNKAILRGGEKTNSGRTIIPDFKKYYRAIVIRTTWCWSQNRQTPMDK